MQLKRIVLTILLIIWMIIIFMFSSQDSNKSESTSDKVASDVIDTVTNVTNQEITEEKKNLLIEDTRVLVRKSAHFTLFFILGVIAYLTFDSYSIKYPILYTIGFCFIYACSDEIHQLFINGRTFKILDIFIDTIGSSISSLILNFIKRKNA